MKKITGLAVLLLLCCKLHAQISYEGTSDYAKLYDITYDASVQNKMYAHTISNHLVVSTDNGSTWSVLYSHPRNFTNMQWVPGTTDFSFSDSEGISVYSTATNTIVRNYPIPDLGVPGASSIRIQGYTIQDAAGTTIAINVEYKFIDESNPDVEDFGKVFYSTNSGTNYNEIYYTANNDNVFITNIAIAPGNAQKIFLSRGQGNTAIDGGLFVSQNGGANWTEKLTGIPVQPLTFKPNNPNEILLGTGIYNLESENIYKSVDGGDTWNVVPGITFTEGILNNVNAIIYNPADTNKIMILEENQIISTTNGGDTWNSANYEMGNSVYYFGLNASYNPFNAGQIVITTDLFPQFTTNNGNTLTQMHVPFLSTRNVGVTQDDTTTHLYYSAEFGYMHKNSSTGITTPYEILPPNASTNNNRTVAYPDAAVNGRLFVLSGAFLGGTLKVSNDYGATTSEILNVYAAYIDNVTSAPSNRNIVYVSLKQDDIYGNFFRIDLTDNSYEEILFPVDYGIVTGVIINPSNPDDITVAKGTNLYRSTNGGTSWTTVLATGLNAGTIWEMAQSPIAANKLIAGTDNGIFTSQDGGATWVNRLPDVIIKKVAYSPLNANVAVAAVYTDYGIEAALYATANGGADWTYVSPQQLDRSQTASMDFSFTNSVITAYIATPDLGIVAYGIDMALLGTADPVLSKNNFVMYPNPASNNITVSTAANDKIKNIAVYSITGQKLIASTKNVIEVSNLSSGIYVVTVITNAGVTTSQKLVKR